MRILAMIFASLVVIGGCSENEPFAVSYNAQEKVIAVADSDSQILYGVSSSGDVQEIQRVSARIPRGMPLQTAYAGEKQYVLLGLQELPRMWQLSRDKHFESINVDIAQFGSLSGRKLVGVYATESALKDCGVSFALGVFDLEGRKPDAPIWSSEDYCSNGGSAIHFASSSSIPIVTHRRVPVGIFIPNEVGFSLRQLHVENPTVAPEDTGDPFGRDSVFVVSDDFGYLGMANASEGRYLHCVWELGTERLVFEAHGKCSKGFRGQCIIADDRITFAEGDTLQTFNTSSRTTRSYKVESTAGSLQVLESHEGSVLVLESESQRLNFSRISVLPLLPIEN